MRLHRGEQGDMTDGDWLPPAGQPRGWRDRTRAYHGRCRLSMLKRWRSGARDAGARGAMTFAGKRITIMGLGFFGGTIGLAKYLVSQGARVTVTDLKPAAALQDSVAALHGLPVRFVLGRHELADFTDADMVFASPAVREDSAYLA